MGSCRCHVDTPRWSCVMDLISAKKAVELHVASPFPQPIFLGLREMPVVTHANVGDEQVEPQRWQ